MCSVFGPIFFVEFLVELNVTSTGCVALHCVAFCCLLRIVLSCVVLCCVVLCCDAMLCGLAHGVGYHARNISSDIKKLSFLTSDKFTL